MDFEVLKNISSDGPIYPDVGHEDRNHLFDIPVAIIGILAIFTSILTIYVLGRHRITHSGASIYIVNICICDILYILLSPVFLNLFSFANTISFVTECILAEKVLLLVVVSHVLIGMLLLDWYRVYFKSKTISERCRKLTIGCTWILFLTFLLGACFQCDTGLHVIRLLMFITTAIFFINFILIILVHRKKRFSKEICNTWGVESNFELSISTWYILCWLPDCILMISETFFDSAGSDYWVLVTFSIGHTYSLLLLAFLYYRDDQFRTSFRKVFNIY